MRFKSKRKDFYQPRKNKRAPIFTSVKHCNAFLLPLLFLFSSCDEKKSTLHPERSAITESVYASGAIKAQDQYTVFPVVSGILSDFLASDGDSVRIGDTLCIIRGEVSDLQRENARLLYELSQENASPGSDRIREAELAVKTAHEKFQLDSSLYDRQKRLWEKKIGSRVEFEQRELAMSQSKSSWLSAKSRLEVLKSQLSNEQKRANVGYRIADEQRSDYAVRSLVNGKIFSTAKERGELVGPQTPLAVIGSSDSFVIELQIDENDITRIQIGQLVLLSLDSYADQVFEAHVSRIYPMMDSRTRTFKVEAIFEKAPASLFPNMTVEANVVIHEKKEALLIPRQYLIEDRYVLLENGDTVEVQIGLSDFRKVEILSGIDTSSALILP
jgi:RND family efflux transporter MFP subunit